jgi:hypothetical protein
VGRDQGLRREPVADQVVLAHLPGEPQALGGVGRGGGWVADPQFRVGKARKDLCQ